MEVKRPFDFAQQKVLLYNLLYSFLQPKKVIYSKCWLNIDSYQLHPESYRDRSSVFPACRSKASRETTVIW